MDSKNNISHLLLNFVVDYDEIENSVNNINSIMIDTFKEVYMACLKSVVCKEHLLKIDSIIDYLNEDLHIGHWSSVSFIIKKAFYTISFFKAVILLQLSDAIPMLDEALKCIDMGILLGLPLDKNSKLLTNSAKLINSQVINIHNLSCNSQMNVKRKYEEFPEFNNIIATQIACNTLPSLQYFIANFYNPQKPVKIQESINHWPAIHKWINISYLLRIAGGRTVPIEVGSQYSDENWSQKLMTLKEFIEKYYFDKCDNIGYLAQHNLLDQIPELKDDICIPDYCFVSRNSSDATPDIETNVWFGPKGTVSSLHFDPKDNLLAQVYGTKLIIMFSPNDGDYLYPHYNQMLFNTAQVDPLKPDLERFPRFHNAEMYKCLLQSGDILYIPPKWWHYVVSLEKSFSVNFWWN